MNSDYTVDEWLSMTLRRPDSCYDNFSAVDIPFLTKLFSVRRQQLSELKAQLNDVTTQAHNNQCM